MVSTTDFDSVSLGSSPSSPTKLTNMEEIEKINIINKRLRQKEARVDGNENSFRITSQG